MENMIFELAEKTSGHIYATLNEANDETGFERISVVLRHDVNDEMIWDITGLRGEMLVKELREKLNKYFPNKQHAIIFAGKEVLK